MARKQREQTKLDKAEQLAVKGGKKVISRLEQDRSGEPAG